MSKIDQPGIAAAETDPRLTSRIGLEPAGDSHREVLKAAVAGLTQVLPGAGQPPVETGPVGSGIPRGEKPSREP